MKARATTEALLLAALAAGCGALPCEPGALCTVAGTGRAGFSGDGAPALDAELYHPVALAFDSLGRLHFNDWNNLRIRRVGEDGVIETVAGSGYEGSAAPGTPALDYPLHHPFSIDFDAAGALYLAGNHSPAVLRIDPDGRVDVVAGGDDPGEDGDGGPATAAHLNAPCGVAVGDDGAIYIADTDNHRIRRVGPDGGIETVAGSGAQGYSGDGGPAREAMLDTPFRVRPDGRGGLLVVDTYNHRVRRVDAEGVITTVASALTLPYDALAGEDGSIFIADTGNHRVVRVREDGAVETVAGTGKPGYDGEGLHAAASRLDRPQGLALADGVLYIADTFNHRVRRVRLP